MEKAYLLINTEIGKEKATRDIIAKIEGVTRAECIYGVYDIVAVIEHENKDMLQQIITEKIRRFDWVRSTLALIVVS